jgi:hypothetical protein
MKKWKANLYHTSAVWQWFATLPFVWVITENDCVVVKREI